MGGRLKLSPQLELSSVWTHYSQNNYNKSATCTDTSASSCSGQEDAYSILAEYKFTKRFELYGGAMYSRVANGLANGFLNTSTIVPTVGMAFRF